MELNLYKLKDNYKILNLYSCLGGNRYKWDEVANIEVTAVEHDESLANLYAQRFPNDVVLVEDAHKYLLHNFKNFDFIWSSPPCPTHSRLRHSQKSRKTFKFKYPEMELYQEIIFLDNFFEGKYVVENVIPYYEPLILAQKRHRHLFWCNFKLPNILTKRTVKIGKDIDEVNKLCDFHKIDLLNYKGTQRKDKIARNLVDYEIGKTILQIALNIERSNNTKQLTIL
jgi:DNA (cytosine-5)-methyltransferase 1